jgi:hypothetical protein
LIYVCWCKALSTAILNIQIYIELSVLRSLAVTQGELQTYLANPTYYPLADLKIILMCLLSAKCRFFWNELAAFLVNAKG